MHKQYVLFVSTFNGCRSQMAEAFLNHIAPDRFFAQSAGIESGALDPAAVEVMKEYGIDISGNNVKNVDDFYRQKMFFNYVILTCERETIKECPSFPGITQKINWSFGNTSRLAADYEERLEKTKQARDEIRAKVQDFVMHY
jgi:arsenate reductase (thioredoxin)